MTHSTDHWTYAQFHAFVMLYAANADGQISKEEEALIMPNLPEEAYAAVKSAFWDCDDADALDIIMGFREKYFATAEAKQKILSDMKMVFEASQLFSKIELGVYRLFERLL